MEKDREVSYCYEDKDKGSRIQELLFKSIMRQTLIDKEPIDGLPGRLIAGQGFITSLLGTLHPCALSPLAFPDFIFWSATTIKKRDAHKI